MKNSAHLPIPQHAVKTKVIFCVRGVLSPLSSNIVLDELDRELEQRKHRFVRYADDCNIYVRSQRAGQRVMNSVTSFLARRLQLKVNETKSAVARPVERKFLGFSFSTNKEPKRRIAPKALLRCKQKIRELTQRTRGISLKQMTKELAAYLRGWKSYFGYCQTPLAAEGSGQMDPASLAMHDLETVETWARAVQEVTPTRSEHQPYREHDKELPRPLAPCQQPGPVHCASYRLL